MAYRTNKSASREYIRTRFRRNKKSNPRRDVVIYLFFMFATLSMMMLAFGLVRYGGVEGLTRRVRIEAAKYRSHTEYVPTPLAPSSDLGLLDVPQVTAISTPSGESQPTTVPAAAPSGGGAATPVPPNYAPARSEVTLDGLAHWWQTWNNCGPATLAMNLTYFGSVLDQTQVGDALRPNKDDKNVSPHEMAEYARSQGYHALSLVNGSVEQLRLLLSNGLPVLVESWIEEEPGNGMGHYRLLIGYSDTRQEWIAYDSFVRPEGDPKQPYSGIGVSYDGFEPLWAVFNRAYLLVYTDEYAPVVRDILGDNTDERMMWLNALTRSQVAVQMNSNDPFALFNLGSDLAALGLFEQAAIAYDRARILGLPWRMMWYQFEPFQAYFEVRRYDEVIHLADATIGSGGNAEEVQYWRGMALLGLKESDKARQAWQQALRLNPKFQEAQVALAQLDSGQ